MKKSLDLLTKLLFFSLITSCSFNPEYLEIETERPLAVIDSICQSNGLKQIDTINWYKSYYKDELSGVSIITYIVNYHLKWKHEVIIVLTKYSDEKYILNYRKE